MVGQSQIQKIPSLAGITGYLETIADKLNNRYAQMAGKLLGELNKVKDALDIAENCSSSEAVALIVGYAGFGIMWSIGMAAFVLFPMVALLVAMLGVFIIGSMLSADIARSEGGLV